MPKMYKVIDNAQSYYIDKKNLVNLCVRMIICGASERSGKSNLILNLLLRPEFYLNDFKGENIFVISPSLKNDNKLKKLIEVKDIPPENLMDEFDESAVTELYKILQEEYEEAISQGEKPEHKLVIMDDIAYSGDLKAMSFGIISKMACNGRHSLINFIITAQKYIFYQIKNSSMICFEKRPQKSMHFLLSIIQIPHTRCIKIVNLK